MTRRFLFPIESGQVLAFARAVGDPNPVFRDPDYASVAARGGVVPPPTFLIAAHHFDPQSMLRPAPGEAVPGSGVIPVDGPVTLSNRPRGLHAEETFRFHRHPRIGEILTVEETIGETREKTGRDSRLEFKDIVWSFVDATGNPVASATWTSVYVHSLKSEPAASAAGSATPPPDAAPVPAPTPLPGSPLHAAQLKPGDRWTAPVVESLRMTHLVRYAGASGDLVALHYDERIVKAMGHPGLFGHGMLTMGLSARMLTAVAGTANLTAYSARMTAIVFPGDTLTATLTVNELLPQPDGRVAAQFSLDTVNQQGRNVLKGKASALLLP